MTSHIRRRSRRLVQRAMQRRAATEEAAARMAGAVRPRRDRHGRGIRGPMAPVSSPLSRTRAEEFDEVVAQAYSHVLTRWGEALGGVTCVVEEVPDLSDWHHSWVPLSRAFPAIGSAPARIVVYRRPVQNRIKTRGIAHSQVWAPLVNDLVVDEVAELLGLDPDQVDPGRR